MDIRLKILYFIVIIFFISFSIWLKINYSGMTEGLNYFEKNNIMCAECDKKIILGKCLYCKEIEFYEKDNEKTIFIKDEKIIKLGEITYNRQLCFRTCVFICYVSLLCVYVTRW